MWIRNQPGWLYEALPYLYLASGIATIVVLRSSMAVFSGLMLISAGMIVWWMRTASRRRARDVPRFPPGVRETLYGAIEEGAIAVRIPKHARKEMAATVCCS